MVVRDNVIQDSFNGMRMKADKKARDSQNHNVEFYGTPPGARARNPVEPERSAMNWWIHHNDIHDAHAWFSLDEVAGGYWYFFGNRGVSKDVPGPRWTEQGRQGLQVRRGRPQPDKPVFAFNNSYWLRSSLIKDGATTLLTHRDNAVLFPPQTEPGRPAFPRPGLPAGRLGPGRQLDHDLTNVPWPPKITDNAQEQNGSMDPGPVRKPGRPRPAPGRSDAAGLPGGPRAGRGLARPDALDLGTGHPGGGLCGVRTSGRGPAFVFLKPADGTRDMSRGPGWCGSGSRGRGLRSVSPRPWPRRVGPYPIKAGGGKVWVDAAASDRDLTAEQPGSMAGGACPRSGCRAGCNRRTGVRHGWSSVFAGLRFYKSPDGPDPRPPEPSASAIAVGNSEAAGPTARKPVARPEHSGSFGPHTKRPAWRKPRGPLPGIPKGAAPLWPPEAFPTTRSRTPYAGRPGP